MIADLSIWRRFKTPLWPTLARMVGLALILLMVQGAADVAFAHGVQGKDAAFVASSSGPQPIAFLYLGAKHMVTGYGHLLFLVGVIFFLRRLKDVALYVSLFSLGHSITLLTGILGKIHINPFLVDAVIGLSVAYKAFDNLGGFRTMLGSSPTPGWPSWALALSMALAWRPSCRLWSCRRTAC